jgi:septal ring-binding cell division protein DamX
MYYVYSSREPIGHGDPPSTASVSAATTDAPARETTRDGGVRFAARMTYELSHTPAEPPPAVVRVAAKGEAPPAPAAAPATPPREPAPRVQNARPIIATPPDPRDTTREMEREARRPEYREPPRQLAQASVEPVQPRIIAGRDIVVPTKPLTTRPIAASEPEPAKRSAEPAAPASSRISVATAAVVSGASPIGPAPEAKTEPQKPKTEAPSANADALGSRLSATREWLAGAPQTTHTIQLMGANSEEQLKSQLKALSKLLEPGKIYVIRTRAHGKPSMTVLYGSYPDRQAALQALEKLPAPIAANKPVLRTVNGIRAEQKQHGVDS